MKNILRSGKALWMSIIAVIAVIVFAIAGWCYKVYMHDPVGGDTARVYLTPGLPATELQASLAQYMPAATATRVVSLMEYMGYGTEVTQRCGYYEVSPQASVYRAARKLIAGSETPIRFTFNNIRTIEQFVARVDTTFYMDGDSLLQLLTDPDVCASYGLEPATIVAMLIPDTYEFYWTVKPQRFLDVIHHYYEQYWTDERKRKAQAAGLTPSQVATLASIVEEETARADEMPVVAGLYLNRLQRGMLLQADPTVKFAVGDFSLRRILLQHLAVESPYNTYRHAGLPPGPIRFPSKAGMDAVLNYRRHDYLYMCAKEDFSGYHNFARTPGEHSRNAARYHAALNRRGIR